MGKDADDAFDFSANPMCTKCEQCSRDIAEIGVNNFSHFKNFFPHIDD